MKLYKITKNAKTRLQTWISGKNTWKYKSADEIIEKLSSYENVTFDIFDTLILRKCEHPTDVFLDMKNSLGIPNFKSLRIKSEIEARKNLYKMKGTYEVSLNDIWETLSKYIDLEKEIGMAEELNAEKNYCYANPVMLQVYQEMLRQNKNIYIVTDMYLSSKHLSQILDMNGYHTYSNLIVSCEEGYSKADGKLYEIVKKTVKAPFIHIGDNLQSDVYNAKKRGIDALWYASNDK